MKTGVLFDLDGVLIDSESIYTEFWEDVDKVFPTNVPDFAHIIKGSTLPKILGTYFPDKNIQQQILDMISCFEKDMRYTPFIEAMRFVGELNEAGIECAIVTSSSLQKNGKSLSPESWIPRQIQSCNNKRSGNILQTAPTAVSPWRKSHWRQPGELLRF